MKKTLFTILICFLILTTILSGCSSQQFISQNVAMDAVRAFEGNQNLQFKVFPLDKDETGNLWEYNYTYTLVPVTNSAIEHSWDVNAVTGEVYSADYTELIAYQRTETPYGNYTQPQCMQAALAFALTKYSGFSNMGFQLVSEKWEENSYAFEWCQILQNGASTNNYINISVNPNTCVVTSYYSTRYQIPNEFSNIPQLTPQQAVDSAVQELGIITLLENDVPELEANPDGLYYSFKINGMYADNERKVVICMIEANTGNLAGFASRNTALIKEVLPLANKQLLNYVVLSPKIKITDIKIKKITATFTNNNQVYKLSTGSDILLIDTKKVKMSGKCVIKGKEVYVPADFEIAGC